MIFHKRKIQYRRLRVKQVAVSATIVRLIVRQYYSVKRHRDDCHKSDPKKLVKNCYRNVKIKVNQSRYRPGVAQRVPGS